LLGLIALACLSTSIASRFFLLVTDVSYPSANRQQDLEWR
jgi:hypothetical protein